MNPSNSEKSTKTIRSYHYWDFNGQSQARLNLAFGIIAVLAIVVIVQGGGLFYAFREIAHPPILKENSDGSVTVANARVTGPVSNMLSQATGKNPGASPWWHVTRRSSAGPARRRSRRSPRGRGCPLPRSMDLRDVVFEG